MQYREYPHLLPHLDPAREFHQHHRKYPDWQDHTGRPVWNDGPIHAWLFDCFSPRPPPGPECGRPEPGAGDHEPPTTMLRTTGREMENVMEGTILYTACALWMVLQLELWSWTIHTSWHCIGHICFPWGNSMEWNWNVYKEKVVCVCTPDVCAHTAGSRSGWFVSVRALELQHRCKPLCFSWKQYLTKEKRKQQAGWPRFDNATLVFRFIYVLILLFPSLFLHLTNQAGSSTKIGVKSLLNRREIGSVIFGAWSWGTVGPSSSL